MATLSEIDRSPAAVVPRAPSVVRPAVVYVVLFAAVGSWLPYVALYYDSIGLPVDVVGLFVALSAAVGLFAAPAWGTLVDSLRDVRRPLLVAGLWSAAAAAALALAREPLLVALCVIALGVSSTAMSPMLDSRTVEILGNDRERYGRARAWGSAAYVAGALTVGFVVARFGPPSVFVFVVPLFALAGVTAFVALGRTRSSHADRHVAPRAANPLAGVGSVLRAPTLAPFFVGTVLVWLSMSAVMTFISLQIVALGGEGPLVGLTSSLGALTEVPLMLLFPVLARRFSPSWLLVAGAVAFSIRALGWALAPEPELIAVVAPFGGVGYALFLVGTVTYVSRAVSRDVQATAQGVFTGTALGLGSIGGAVLGGALAGALGLRGLFVVAAGIVLVAAVVIWWALVRRGKAIAHTP